MLSEDKKDYLVKGGELELFWNKIPKTTPLTADEESISIQDEVITAMLLTDDDIRAICK